MPRKSSPVLTASLSNLMKFFATPFKDLERRNVVENTIMVVGLLVMVCIIYHYRTADIELKLAYEGYSPHDYVARKIHPQNFEKDFYFGTLIYDNSLPMITLYSLARYFTIPLTISIYPYMFIQTLLFIISCAFLTQTLFEKRYITFIAVGIISLSSLAGLNL